MGRMGMSHSALAFFYKAVQAAPQIPLLEPICDKSLGWVKKKIIKL